MYVSLHKLTQGVMICRKAYSSVLGISLKRLKSIFEDYKANITYDKVPRKVILSEKLRVAIAWMKQYFNRFGEAMPHVNQVRL